MAIFISNAFPPASIAQTNAAANVFGINGANANTFPGPAAANMFSGTANGTTNVSLSGPGQLLAAASTFQHQLAMLQPGAANSGIGDNFGTDFGSLAAEAQNFVDAFNQVRDAVGKLPAGTSQASEFTQALNTQLTTNFANGNSGVNTLDQIGIAPDASGRLRIDMNALQTAFNANPSATFSLLAQAVQGFGNVAAGVQTASLNQNLSAILNQLVALEAELSLFNTGGLFGSGGTTPLSLAGLLALGPLGQGAAGSANNAANNNLNQFAALSHFALVSALLT